MGSIDRLKIKQAIEEDAKKRYRDNCKHVLSKNISKKITTTMIGALDAIEKEFGFLWNQGDIPTNNQQRDLKEKYDLLRKRILDLGNSQIKKVDEDLNNYDIENKRYHYVIPLVSERKENE